MNPLKKLWLTLWISRRVGAFVRAKKRGMSDEQARAYSDRLYPPKPDEAAYEEEELSRLAAGGPATPPGHLIRRATKWFVGYILFSALYMGAFYGLIAAETPWWSWACIAFVVVSVVRLIPGRIRNGYWGASPSTSAWGQIKAEEVAYEESSRRKPPSN